MIYIDLVFILNYLIDLLLLLFTVAVILRRQTKLKKLLLGALVGTMTMLFLFLDISNILLFIIKIIMSIFMSLVAFDFKNIRYTLKNIFYLYTSSIILGGFLYLLSIEFSFKHNGLSFYDNGLSINFIILIIISPIIIYLYIKQAKELKNNYSNYYNIDIYLLDGRVLEMTAFLDTGNTLVDPYQKRPIILVNKKSINFKYNNNFLLVPYDTVNKHGLLRCIIPNYIYIHGIGIKTNFLVGISEEKINIDGVDCLLHSGLMEEI